MAKKKEEAREYIPSDQDLINARICWKEKNIAYSMSRAYPNEDNLYYVERYKLSNVKKTEFVKIDPSKPDSSFNRKKFNLYEAGKLIFDLYRKTSGFLDEQKEEQNKSNTENKKDDVSKSKSSQGSIHTPGRQIDLLESIEEIENEVNNQ